MNRVILVYDGDSGLAAMLLDAVKKAVGREDCALCEIIYSPVGKKREWVACQRRLGVEVEELHRDRIPPSWGITELPCVLGRNGEARPAVLLDRGQIAACRGSVTELERRLRQALLAKAS